MIMMIVIINNHRSILHSIKSGQSLGISPLPVSHHRQQAGNRNFSLPGQVSSVCSRVYTFYIVEPVEWLAWMGCAMGRRRLVTGWDVVDDDDCLNKKFQLLLRKYRELT